MTSIAKELDEKLSNIESYQNDKDSNNDSPSHIINDYFNGKKTDEDKINEDKTDEDSDSNTKEFEHISNSSSSSENVPLEMNLPEIKTDLIEKLDEVHLIPVKNIPQPQQKKILSQITNITQQKLLQPEHKLENHIPPRQAVVKNIVQKTNNTQKKVSINPNVTIINDDMAKKQKIIQSVKFAKTIFEKIPKITQATLIFICVVLILGYVCDLPKIQEKLFPVKSNSLSIRK